MPKTLVQFPHHRHREGPLAIEHFVHAIRLPNVTAILTVRLRCSMANLIASTGSAGHRVGSACASYASTSVTSTSSLSPSGELRLGIHQALDFLQRRLVIPRFVLIGLISIYCILIQSARGSPSYWACVPMKTHVTTVRIVYPHNTVLVAREKLNSGRLSGCSRCGYRVSRVGLDVIAAPLRIGHVRDHASRAKVESRIELPTANLEPPWHIGRRYALVRVARRLRIGRRGRVSVEAGARGGLQQAARRICSRAISPSG